MNPKDLNEVESFGKCLDSNIIDKSKMSIKKSKNRGMRYSHHQTREGLEMTS